MADHTFVLADMAGFTALTEAHGDDHAADTAAAFIAESRARLTAHQAEEVKTLGDAMLLWTPHASAGLGLAVRLVTELGHRHQQLALRVAVHTGSAVSRGGDWFGSAVNLVARVSSVVQTGQVVATEATVQAAESPPSIRPLGLQRFKNVELPVPLYALQLPATAQPLLVDPVCRMALSPAQAQHRSPHGGTEYVFCSEHCQQRFLADPASFLRAPHPR